MTESKLATSTAAKQKLLLKGFRTNPLPNVTLSPLLLTAVLSRRFWAVACFWLMSPHRLAWPTLKLILGIGLG